MQKLISLIDSLYQEFFTGKGSLSLELIVPGQEGGGGGKSPPKAEGWNLSQKEGRLQLRADSLLSLAQALSFFARLPPAEIEPFLGPQKFHFSKRVLKLKDDQPLTEEIVKQAATLGFNTLATATSEVHLAQEYGLEILKYNRPEREAPFSRDLLYKDYLVQQIARLDPHSLFDIKEAGCFEELHFESGNDVFIGYKPTESTQIKLSEAQFKNSNFLPTLTLSHEKSTPLSIEQLARMQAFSFGAPNKGWVVEYPEWPAEVSNLWAAGFAQITGVPAPRLYQWINLYLF